MSFFVCSKVGKYHEALGKWEAAITLMPERATLHEQKAQVLLEIGETWKSLTAANPWVIYFYLGFLHTIISKSSNQALT
ncbi:putative tetratricopeptide-like helical domain superfamily [Helianthus annuus]|nr:putative tetratricopeptide-like helical domain superfamily [Helianthus annuus]